jgi:two-component system, chemotaxis family, chemotaxis protein CheY
MGILDEAKEQQLRVALEGALQHLAEMKSAREENRLSFTMTQADVLAARRKGHRRPCVLVVEDDRFMSAMVKQLLEDTCEVKVVQTGEEAAQAYPSLAPDIIFLDIDLPDMDGFEVLRRLQAMDPRAFIVMFSGNSYQDNLCQALQEGAKGFIAKPFTRQALINYLIRSPHVASHSSNHA